MAGEVVRPGGGGSLRACAPLLCSRVSWKRWPRRLPPACKPRRRQRHGRRCGGETLLSWQPPPPPGTSRGISGFSKIGPGHRVAQPSKPSPRGAWRREDSDRRGTPPSFALPRFNHSGEGAKRPLAAGPGHPSPLPPGPELAALIRRTRKKAPGALLRTRQPQ